MSDVSSSNPPKPSARVTAAIVLALVMVTGLVYSQVLGGGVLEKYF